MSRRYIHIYFSCTHDVDVLMLGYNLQNVILFILSCMYGCYMYIELSTEYNNQSPTPTNNVWSFQLI